MERNISKLSLYRYLLMLIATICLISISALAFASEGPIARLTSFSGTVLIKSQGSWGVQPDEDLPLYSEDKIVTRIGLATITFNDGAIMEVRPNSNLLIQESEEDTGIEGAAREVKRRLRLLLGKMLFRTNRSSSVKTNLESSTMVCGLRGTEGIISIGADGQTYLQFTEGGGDVIGAFISGEATDVPTELANLNPVQRAAFVAAAAASQAAQAAEAAATGEITDADAAMVAAQAAEAAAQEAKIAAEAMLTNPDPEIQEQAAQVIEAADRAIDDAQEAQDDAIESGATTRYEPEDIAGEGVEEGEEIGFDVDAEGADYNEWGLTEEDRRVWDIIPPLISVSMTPARYTNIDSALFEFSIEDNITASGDLEISYTIDGGEPVALEPPDEAMLAELGGEPYIYSIDFSGLTEQQHAFTITAIDEMENIGEVTYVWTTDYTPPIALFSTKPAAIDNISSFGLDAEDTNKSAGITYEYSIDEGGTWSTTTSASLDLGLAADGVYMIKMKATDAAGNTGNVVAYSWTYDATAPVIAVTYQPATLTNSTVAEISAEYTNTEPGTVTFTYTLNGSSVETPALTSLVDGVQEFVITATDQAGNSSTNTVTWEVDATAPVNAIVASKSATADSIDFTLSSQDANEVTYAWALIDASGSTIASGTGESVNILTAELADGTYTLTWEVTDAATNTAVGEAEGFTFDQYTMVGNVAGTGSVITGTATGTTSIVGGEGWGEKTVGTEMSGTWSGTHSGPLSIASGGSSTGTMEEGLWLSTTSGSITGTDATGTTDYRMLTPTTLMEGSGTFTGTFATDNTWSGSEEALDLTYTTLTFSSIFSGTESGGLYQMFDGTYYEGDYEYYDGYEYWGEYNYEYFLADSYFDFSGETPIVSDVDTILFGSREKDEMDYYYETIYVPYGRQPGIGLSLEMGDDTFYPGEWTIGSLTTDFFTNPTDLGIYLTDPYWQPHWYSYETMNILAQSGEFSGIMGGAGDLWAGTADLSFLGIYEPWDGDYSTPSIFSAPLLSSEITLGTLGGAYQGFLIGSIDSAVIGDLYAIYVKNDGSGGILSGDFSGLTYQDIGRWDGSGSVSAIQLAGATGVTPIALEGSLKKGMIAGWTYGNEMGWGQTLSVANDSGWGIFDLLLGAGNYGFDPAAQTWTSKAGGVGTFSDYNYGYWMTDSMSGTANNGMLSGSLTGKLLNLTHYADLSGSVIGTYDETGVWQAIVGGYWNNSQDLYFSGETWGDIGLSIKSYWGEGYNATNDHFYYSYNELTGTGWSSLDLASGTSTNIEYNPDGTYEEWEIASDGTLIYNSTGTWDGGDLLAYLEGVAAEYNVESYSSSDYYLEDVGWLDGIIGGLDPLWAATVSAPADIIMLGEFDAEDESDYSMPSIFNSEIGSLNPIYNNDTIWSQAGLATIGAYFGYGAGITLSETDSIPLQGSLLALYVDNSGNAGYLKGGFNGDAYQDERMWEATGTVYPEQVASSVGIAPENFDIAYGGGWGMISGQLGSTGTLNYDIEQGEYYNYVDLRTNSIIDYTTSTALPWGIYSGTITGSFNNPENATTWTSKIGGEADFGAYFYDTGGWSNDWGYYIADTTGTTSSWASGILSADQTGSFLTYTKAGDLEGELLGTYLDNFGTFQAVNLGTWSWTDLAFASDFNPSIYHATWRYNGDYTTSNGDEYIYWYNEDNSEGYFYYYDNATTTSTQIWYYSNGDTYDYSTGYVYGGWDPDTQLLSDIVGQLPEGYDWQGSISEFLTTTSTGNLYGRMGGTDSLWSGIDIPFTLMGEYDDYGFGSVWSDYLTSYNYKNYTYTTYDGGAYYGYMGGIKKNDNLEGLLTAIYIAPDGSAGYLTGDVAGYGDPGIEMFDMNGTINRTEVVSAGGIGIAPGDLYNSVSWGDTYTKLSGNFNGSGSISTNDLYFELYSIPGESWGIYGGSYYGTFENPGGETVWNSRIGGDAYFPGDISNYGYLLAETASTWENNVLTASLLNGRFLTQTLMGDVFSGDLLGTYTGTTSGTWEAASLGTWSGTDLAFASNFSSYIYHAIHEYGGRYDYTGPPGPPVASYYQYEYNDDDSYGYVYLYSNDGTGGLPFYQIYYYANGSYQRGDWNYDTSSFDISYGNWIDEGLVLADIMNPPDEYGTDYSINENFQYVDLRLNNTGYPYMSSLMGGTTSLWTGSDPIPVTLMGYYDGDYGLGYGIWSSDIYSHNYIDSTNTTYDGGAYYGRIVGTKNNDNLTGLFSALYIAPNSSVGYLIGDMAGNAYPGIEMFEMDGNINRVELFPTTGLAASDLMANLSHGYPYYYGDGAFGGGGSISVNNSEGYSSSILEADFGILSYSLYGEYSETASDTWSMSLNDSYGYQWIEINGTPWSEGKIDGDTTGAWFDDTGTTGVIGGELIGTFDPNTYTWEAVSSGAWIDTTRFLDMADPANTTGNEALEALNIPYIEVGRDTLSGTGGYYMNMYVEMTDTTFFSYSTGAPPAIWASGSVTGSNSQGTSEIGSTVTLNGASTDLTAEFAMELWQSGAWSAAVNNGSGTVGGHTITFEGGAAGTHPGDGTFTGTAAGVAK